MRSQPSDLALSNTETQASTANPTLSIRNAERTYRPFLEESAKALTLSSLFRNAAIEFTYVIAPPNRNLRY